MVNGAIPEASALLQLEWGLIFFTGSERVGKIIAGAAAKTLTPVVLELGGKSPVYIDDSLPEISSMVQVSSQLGQLDVFLFINIYYTCPA